MALPFSSTSSCGEAAACAMSKTRRIAPVGSASPCSSNLTVANPTDPSREIVGELTSVTCGRRATRVSIGATLARATTSVTLPSREAALQELDGALRVGLRQREAVVEAVADALGDDDAEDKQEQPATDHAPAMSDRPAGDGAWTQALEHWVSPFSDSISLSLGGVGEGVGEGIEGAVARDHELEAVSGSRVLDRDGQLVLARVPEQQDVQAVVLSGGEFPRIRWRGTHGSSFWFERGCCDPDHGISTSLTRATVVRSAM